MKHCLTLLVACCLISCEKKVEVAPAPPAASGNHDASGPLTEAKLGLKYYPGARVVTSGETSDLFSANLQTSDEPAKVIAFYETELGVKATGGKIKTTKDNHLMVVSTAPSEGGTAVSIMVKK